MKSIVRYTLISFICIAVIFTATAVALGLYFDPSVAHIELEKDTRIAQGNFETLDIELISAEKTANTVRIFFALHIPEGINASEVQLKSVIPHFPFAKPEGGYDFRIYEASDEANTLTYEMVINAQDFPITAHPMTLEVSDLTYVENPLETIIDFTGELRFIVK